MRIGMVVLAAALLAAPVHAQPKGFNAAEFVKSRMQINAEKQLGTADWKKFDAAFAKCASSANETAFIGCMNRELKSASATFSLSKKS